MTEHTTEACSSCGIVVPWGTLNSDLRCASCDLRLPPKTGDPNRDAERRFRNLHRHTKRGT